MAQINIPFEPVYMDMTAFDKMIAGHGVVFLHYKAIPCPVGLVDALDSREGHGDHTQCSNGFIYEYAGEVTGLFRNNSAFHSLSDPGVLDGSSAAVTLNRFYDNDPNKEVFAMMFDRFFLKEFKATVPMTQRLEASITGRDRLQYPVESIESVYDNTGKRYGDSDFSIQNGQLVWTSNNRPQFNAELNKGAVISVRYQYRPYFYVSRIMHEIRMMKQEDFMNGTPVVVRAPYDVLLSREYYFHKQQRDGSPLEPDSDRLSVSPRSGVFSPR